MDDLWTRTLIDLRSRFFSLQKPETPVFNFVVERLPIPGRPPDQFDPSPIPANLLCRKSTLSLDDPCPCALTEWIVEVPESHLKFADKTGKVWAALSLPLNRSIELRSNSNQQIEIFEAIAEDAGRAMLATPIDVLARFPASIHPLCHPRERVTRHRFGKIDNEPDELQTDGTYSGILMQEHGVIVDYVSPGTSYPRGKEDWILLMHRLAWGGYVVPRLEAKRKCWGKGGTVTATYEIIHDRTAQPNKFRQNAPVDPTRWYSVLGDATPLDVFDASARAIDILLEHARLAKELSATTQKPAVAPAPATPSGASAIAVELRGRNTPALVNGKEKQLTSPQYDVIEALIKARPVGLTKDGIEKIKTDARGILTRLKRDPDWNQVIHMAGAVGGRYRIS